MAVSVEMKALEELITNQRFAVLATSDKGAPYGNLVAFAAANKGDRLLFATHSATRKFDNITTDNRVALVIDNRTNDPKDLHSAYVATALGTARPLSGSERDDNLEIFLSKHGYLSGRFESPEFILFEVQVEVFNVVTRFQNVAEIRMQP